MRRVLHVISTGGPGGAETVCANLIENLDRRHWRPFAVVPDDGWIHRRLRSAGVEPIVLPSGRRSDADYLRGLARAAREHRISLVHSHLWGPTVVASVLGLLHRLPVVGTIHGENDLSPGERLRRLKFHLLNHGARRLVFVSEPLRRRFLSLGPLDAHRTMVIPNGIEPAFFTTRRDGSLRRELDVAEGDFLVGAVGNLRPVKGYDVLLRAAALLRERMPGFRFVIAGEAKGPVFRDLLELRDGLGLRDHVHFTGFREDVPRLMADLDLYVISSRSEGFSLSTVQALGLALPVVATRCGGPEMILEDGRSGVLVEPESPVALADAIERLRRSPEERLRLREEGRRTARERFTVQEQARRYERLYQDCISGPRFVAHAAVPV